MAVFVISYDLMSPGQKYKEIEIKIESLGSCKKGLESFWFLSTTTHTSMSVRDELYKAVDANDKIFVAKIGPDWAGFTLEQDVVEWLNKQSY